MTEFWDNIFKSEQLIWGVEPSESAIMANDYFVKNKILKVLVPGIGYGRNANLFEQNNMQVTGIEISNSAIQQAKEYLNLRAKIHLGSVLEMPFDQEIYEGIFCYSLIHLFNKFQRKSFLSKCYNQLRIGGAMFFTVISKEDSSFEEGKRISKDRVRISKDVNVFYYNSESIEKEFKPFGLVDYYKIDEPIKFKQNEPALKCYFLKCKKTKQ